MVGLWNMGRTGAEGQTGALVAVLRRLASAPRDKVWTALAIDADAWMDAVRVRDAGPLVQVPGGLAPWADVLSERSAKPSAAKAKSGSTDGAGPLIAVVAYGKRGECELLLDGLWHASVDAPILAEQQLRQQQQQQQEQEGRKEASWWDAASAWLPLGGGGVASSVAKGIPGPSKLALTWTPAGLPQSDAQLEEMQRNQEGAVALDAAGAVVSATGHAPSNGAARSSQQNFASQLRPVPMRSTTPLPHRLTADTLHPSGAAVLGLSFQGPVPSIPPAVTATLLGGSAAHPKAEGPVRAVFVAPSPADARSLLLRSPDADAEILYVPSLGQIDALLHSEYRA
jgi:hypothetical protein